MRVAQSPDAFLPVSDRELPASVFRVHDSSYNRIIFHPAQALSSASTHPSSENPAVSSPLRCADILILPRLAQAARLRAASSFT